MSISNPYKKKIIFVYKFVQASNPKERNVDNLSKAKQF